MLFGLDTCQTQCMQFPNDPNPLDYNAGDSIQCRVYHTEQAKITGNYSFHCPHGSSLGGQGVCGTAVNTYCDQIMSACTGSVNTQFGSYADCTSEGLYYPDANILVPASPSVTSGDSLDCRMNWTLAILLNPSMNPSMVTAYCSAAGPLGNDNGTVSCGSACNIFCDHYMTTCTINAGSVYQYASYGDCVSTCSTWKKYLPLSYLSSTPTGNSFNCRFSHVVAAGSGGMVGSQSYAQYHCPHASPSGGGVCSTASYTLATPFLVLLLSLVAFLF